MWRKTEAESKRKDELIDRLLKATVKATDVTEKSVDHAEKRERSRRAGL